MKQSFLELLRCPYCGSIFELSEVIEEYASEIITGCLKCECNSFPILEGIPIIFNNSVNKYILKSVINKDITAAFALAINGYSNDICRVSDFISSKPSRSFLKKIIIKSFGYLYRDKRDFYSDGDRYFWDILGAGLYQDYLRHRFSCQTFWTLYPFIPIIQKKKQLILDLCGGCGHASFVISNYINPDELVCVDADFRNLYLAKKYFSKGEFININANEQLPFKNHIFSSVLMMDAFHYIHAKSLLSKELSRIAESDGNIVLLHIHNSLVENVAAGIPITPSNLQNLFEDSNIKILPEEKIIRDFIQHSQLNLKDDWGQEDLSSSNLILIKSPYREDISKLWDKINPTESELIINPIYKIKSKNENKIHLELEFPSEYFRKEYPITESFLVHDYELDLNNLDSTLIENLIRKFILINVPKKYIDSDPHKIH
jgi:SAM-dependent methyltransferase/uncharacterized protein YbaR (Trm112 family)